MHPIVTILEIAGHARPIGGYGVMLALAMLVGAFVTVRAGSRAGLEVGDLIALVGFAAGGGMAGGYALFVAVELARGVPLGEVLTSGGGLVFYGSPIGGVLAVALACRMLGVSFARFADSVIQAVPITHAIGRFGCFLGGCCFGAPWEGPWAVRYTHPFAPGAHPSVLRHPAPLYEAFGLLVLALVFMLVPARSVGTGKRALTYVLAYAALRFTVELFRGDAVRGFHLDGALSTSQLLSLLFGAFAALLLLRRRGAAAVSAA